MTKQSLLLVDSDAKSLRILEVSLRKAGFTVGLATDGSDALAKIEKAPPDLIISNTHMPGMDGFSLCAILKQKPQWADIPFVFLTSQSALKDKVRGLELGVEDYLTKPIFVREVTTRVSLLLQRKERRALAENAQKPKPARTKFSGQLADMALVELVQVFDISHKSGVILLSGRNNKQGAVYFHEGVAIDAELGGLTGVQAIYRALIWADGEFDLEFKEVKRPDQIKMSTQALLLEGMRRLDEWNALCESLPSLDTRFEVDFRELAERLAEIPDEITAILRLFDGLRTLARVVEDAPFGDLETLNVISKLYTDGFIHEIKPKDAQNSTKEKITDEAADREKWHAATQATGVHTKVGQPTASIGESKMPRDEGAPQVELEMDMAAVVAPSEQAGQVLQFPSTIKRPHQHTAADDLGMIKGETAASSKDNQKEEAAPQAPQVLIDTGLRREIVASSETTETAKVKTPTPAPVAAVVSEDDLVFPARNSRVPLMVTIIGAAALVAVGLAWIILPRIKAAHKTAAQQVVVGVDASTEVVPALAIAIDASQAAIVQENTIIQPVDAGTPSSIVDSPDAAKPIIAKVVDAAAPLAIKQMPPAQAGAATPAVAGNYANLIDQSRQALRRGRASQAQTLLEQAVKIQPDGEEGLALLARVYLDREQTKKALIYAEKVIAKNPKHAEAYLVQGIAAQMLNDKATARAAYQQYLKLDPKGKDASEIKHILSTL